MKKKKLLGMALTGTMVLAMAVPAFAEEAQDIMFVSIVTGGVAWGSAQKGFEDALVNLDGQDSMYHRQLQTIQLASLTCWILL